MHSFAFALGQKSEGSEARKIPKPKKQLYKKNLKEQLEIAQADSSTLASGHFPVGLQAVIR